MEVLFSQGPGTASVGARSIIVVAPKTAAGTYTVNTVYRVRNEKDVSDGGGIGSPLHRAIRAGLRRNPLTKWYALPYAATSGGSPATATATITYATSASGIGTADVWIAGEKISVLVKTGDSVTATATSVKDAINAREHLPVTATNASGVVTLTARIAGISQGTATIRTIGIRAEITSGIGTTVSTSGAFIGTATAGVDGSTTEVANLTTALATIDAARYYYVVTTTSDVSSFAALKTHLTNKAYPNPGLRSVGICGYIGTLAAAQTLGTALNYERLQLVWQLNSEHDIAELVGAMAATRQLLESVDPVAPDTDGYRGTALNLQRAYAQSDWPDVTDQNDAINSGVTPIASDESGGYLVMSVTTRSKNAAGTVADFRAAETHRVSVADFCSDELLSEYAKNYSGKKLRSDELNSDQTVNTNQRLPRNTVTAETFKPFPRRKLFDWESRGLTQNAQASSDSLQVVRDPNNSGRLEVGMDLKVIDILHQATIRVAEVSEG